MSSDPVNIFIKDVQNFTQIFMLSNQLSVDVLKEVNDTSHLFTLDHPQPFWVILKQHSNIVIKHTEQRVFWIEQMAKYHPEDVQKEIQTKIDKQNGLLNDYLSKVDILGDKEGKFKGKLTQFFNLTNAFRNASNRELNQIDSIISDNIRNSALAKNPDLKKSVHVDYGKSRKAFSDEDQKLRKRMSEILNATSKK